MPHSTDDALDYDEDPVIYALLRLCTGVALRFRKQEFSAFVAALPPSPQSVWMTGEAEALELLKDVQEELALSYDSGNSGSSSGISTGDSDDKFVHVDLPVDPTVTVYDRDATILSC